MSEKPKPFEDLRAFLEASARKRVTAGYALLRSAVLILSVFAIGTLGYWWLADPKYTLFDAFYMTAITLTTVGYGETIDLSNNVPGRLFTVLLLFSGVGVFVYFFSSLLTFAIEGSLDSLFAERRMRKTIEQLEDHFIVCGGGFVGQRIIQELLATQRAFVLIEQDMSRIQHVLEEAGGAPFPYVLGDATDDDTLHAAGIMRAGGLVVCMTNDKDNLITTFSSRLLNPNLRIVSRSSDPKVEKKLYRAGANAVVSPNTIGGLRMVSEMVRPTAVSFLDTILHGREEVLRVEEVLIQDGSHLANRTLQELRQQLVSDLLVVALCAPDGEWEYNPKGNSMLAPNTRVVFISDVCARRKLEELAAALP